MVLAVSRLPQPLKSVPKTDKFSTCSYYFRFCLVRQSVGCLPIARKPVPQVPHTHDNLETLNKISGTEWTQLVSTRHYHNNIETLNRISPGDYENLSSKFPARITALEDSLGDIAAALADIVEVTE